MAKKEKVTKIRVKEVHGNKVELKSKGFVALDESGVMLTNKKYQKAATAKGVQTKKRKEKAEKREAKILAQNATKMAQKLNNIFGVV